MERVPEPELMNEEEQARAYAEADFEAPHSAFDDLLLRHLPQLPESGVAVDLGCGPGDITFRVARALPGWTIIGVDGAAAMLLHGQEDLMRQSLSERVRLVHAHLPVNALPAAPFDFLFSNSLLHHLAEPMVLWETIRTVGKPGAPVFIMDLARPESREEARRLVEEHSGGEPPILKKDFHNSLLAAYRVEEVEEQLRRSGLPLEVETVSDRHWIAHGRI
jgi:ubiquinone/menaquinone biosynthesis C-methylase UbiE